MKLVDNFGGRRFLGLTPKGKPTSEQLSELKSLSEEIKDKQQLFLGLEESMKKAAMMLPNLPDDTVPAGKDENGNYKGYAKGISVSN